MLDVILDTTIDALKILPFLFLAYVAMEYMEHKMSQKTKDLIQKSGKVGPLYGGLLGILPQCGFSVAASNLYVGRIITLGTLIAVYLSTSDEMLPILISEQVPIWTIIKILLLKAFIGIVAGFIIDFVLRKKEKQKENITHLCEHEHCHCNEKNIFISALKHSINIFIFIYITSFLLNLLFHYVGEEALAGFILNKPIIGEILAGIVGLIPNCAASVVITELYINGIISLGAMMSGLLVGAGVGLLILFKINDDIKENLKITLLLYLIGVISGILIELSGISAFFA